MIAKVFFNTKDIIFDGINAVINMHRYQKYRGLVIRAKRDNQIVNPLELDRKRVFYTIKEDKDKNGIKRPYLLLYARSENEDKTDGLPTLVIDQYEEKHTTYGSYRYHDFQVRRMLLDQNLYSRLAGTHWTRQVVALCESGAKCSITEKYRSNLGNIKQPERRELA